MIILCPTFLNVTTNLTMDEIKAKYGLRTFDRLRANMQVVVIREKSLRGGSMRSIFE